MKYMLAVSLTCLIVSASCNDFGASYAGSFLGVFSYRAVDTSNVLVAQGTIALYRDGSKISGNWRFDDGRSGELEGTAGNGDLSLNLNPGWIDNNLILRGALSGKTFAGSWEQIGFPGVMARGTFTAVRVR